MPLALDVVFSMIVDDLHHVSDVRYQAVAAAGGLRQMGPPDSRHDIIRQAQEVLERPLDEEEAAEYDRDLWARKSVEAMAGMPQDDDGTRSYGPA